MAIRLYHLGDRATNRSASHWEWGESDTNQQVKLRRFASSEFAQWPSVRAGAVTIFGIRSARWATVSLLRFAVERVAVISCAVLTHAPRLSRLDFHRHGAVAMVESSTWALKRGVRRDTWPVRERRGVGIARRPISLNRPIRRARRLVHWRLRGRSPCSPRCRRQNPYFRTRRISLDGRQSIYLYIYIYNIIGIKENAARRPSTAFGAVESPRVLIAILTRAGGAERRRIAPSAPTSGRLTSVVNKG